MEDIVELGGLKWLVLHTEPGRALVVTKDILRDERGYPFYKQYSQTSVATTWATCSLRIWLNHDFLERFSPEETERIIGVRVSNGKGPETIDRVFCLSPDAADELMTQEQRSHTWNWWLRASSRRGSHADEEELGFSGQLVPYVNSNGAIVEPGWGAESAGYIGVRPAMWIAR